MYWHKEIRMKIFLGLLVLVTAGITAQAQEAKVVTETMARSESVVKNSPFSAEAISESVQTLADGNRIVHSSTTKLYRNSEGRLRREMLNGSGGILGTSFSYGTGVTITDPVGGNMYLLNDKLKIAEQSLLRATTVMPQIKAAAALSDEQRVAIEKMRSEGGSRTPMTDEQRAAIEKLTSEMKAIAP